MNEAMLRELVNRRPFQPLALRLSSGESYEIRHPENVFLTKSRIVIAFPETDQLVIASLLHVTSVALVQAA